MPLPGRGRPAIDMTPAPIPINEARRIHALHALKILDTETEERFDRLTRLAKRLFDVPMAVVSLVDSDRQWFKSSYGLSARETPREQSFCAHAILGEDIFLVPDAHADVRFQDNPLVTGAPHIRFYAGCPLEVGEGLKVGTLCMMDTKPRTLDEHDRSLLRDLAKLVEQELVSAQLASMDDLTQLSNRRGFTMLSERALATCGRNGWPATLVFFDLDGFKTINDRFGHAEGDRALLAFAGLLRSTLRNSDVLGRLGGDEFAALLVDATTEDSEALLERFGTVVDAHNRQHPDKYTLRFSSGAVGFDPQRHRDILDLLSAADRRMYAHKRSQS